MANRLRLILPKIIDECQSAFIPGKSISDNVLIAFEVLHALRRNKNSKSVFFYFFFLALKVLDMSKAYDWVEWEFDHVMFRLGFNTKRRMWVRECLSSVSN